MFPVSLRERAKAWLNSLPTGSITTWDDLAQKFLSKYFPPVKTTKLRNDITTFTQDDGESLYEAWERFKDMPSKCPHHGLEVWLQVSSFYNGLHNQARQTLDATAGGIFGNKRPHEAYNLIEEIAMNNYQCRHPEVKSITADIEQVDFVGTNRPQNNPYSNTYNPGWKNHPKFRWKDNNQGQSGFGQQQQFQQRQPRNFQPRQQFQGPTKMGNRMSMEEAVTKLISTTESQALLADSHHKQYEERFSLHEAEFKTQKATLQSIETQLGQIAKLLSERQPGCLPSNTETNLKANVSAITLRNSKIYPEPPYARRRNGLVKTPIGVIENLLVKVGKFVFPADFMVLEMGQDFSLPLILGRPFLATARAVIDMNEGILTFSIGKQSVTYNIGGYECMSSDPLEISHFIDSNLDYQLQKAKDLKKRKAPDLTKPNTPDPTTIDLTKDLDNTNWIDEYFDKLPKLNEEIGEIGEKAWTSGLVSPNLSFYLFQPQGRITSPDHLSTLRSYTPTLRAWSRKPHKLSEKFNERSIEKVVLSKKKREVRLLPGDLKELDTHSFDFSLLSCLHFAKRELPTELREKIFQATSDVRKLWRKQEQLPPLCGLSKSVTKRRAKRYDRCSKCSNWSHDGKCSKNQTDSQNEYTHLIEVGDVRLRAERTIRKGSTVYYTIRDELNLMRDLGLGNLTINEPSD
ncbi:hypothetical protein L1987_54655 [Smallanthus sonchifolius]|uniref:Uncharacterized protein n=1 Tax=Smallanthus sonchifolius TaxID=185202 RepID=A0ACB9E8E5_9ASTR|nr:hypothetical protein L1987_54655 [Smallanthus sonchifolius]